MTQHLINIDILGKEYTINCPKGQEEQLRRAAQALQDRLIDTQKKTQLLNNHNILIMTALNMSNDILELTDNIEQLDDEA